MLGHGGPTAPQSRQRAWQPNSVNTTVMEQRRWSHPAPKLVPQLVRDLSTDAILLPPFCEPHYNAGMSKHIDHTAQLFFGRRRPTRTLRINPQAYYFRQLLRSTSKALLVRRADVLRPQATHLPPSYFVGYPGTLLQGLCFGVSCDTRVVHEHRFAPILYSPGAAEAQYRDDV